MATMYENLCGNCVLSRTVHRLKMNFRSSKDFKAVEKLNRVLRTVTATEFRQSLSFC
jgi:hypothetical protein